MTTKQPKFLLVNKPIGPTSFDIIYQLRKITGLQKIGHSGTLDPFASGLLIVALGQSSTRQLNNFNLEKTYQATLQLGAISDSYDLTGKIQITNGQIPSPQTINEIVLSWQGQKLQTPPMFSAKKIKGVRLYRLARQGKEIDRPPRLIKISKIKINHPETINLNQTLELELTVSSGTYIRSIAHDLGQQLGSGAYLKKLTRTAISNFQLSDSCQLNQLNSSNWQQKTISFNHVLASGTFDHLHPGHLFYLKKSKAIGKKLTVLIGTDKNVTRLKKQPPLQNQTIRAQAVEKLNFVDQVVIGAEGDPFPLIKKINPDLISLGYDQTAYTTNLAKNLKLQNLNTKIVRAPAYQPEIYKSSLQRHLFKQETV